MKNVFDRFKSLSAGILIFLVVVSVQNVLAQNSDLSRQLNAGQGTVEFTVKVLNPDFADGENLVLFQGSSVDGKEFYEIQMIGDDLLALRDFTPCVRSVVRAPHDFKAGERYKLILSWNGATTRFFINDSEITGTNLLVNDDEERHVPFVKFNGADRLGISDIRITAHTSISPEAADRDFAEHCQCPQLNRLGEGKAQEEYKGIALFGFPDEASRSAVKGFIDILPAAMSGALKRVIFVDDAQRLLGYQGLTVSSDTFYLRKGFEADTFFHESAHTFDILHGENDSQAWKEKFFKKEERPAFATGPVEMDQKNGSVLGMLDDTSPREQLAQFTGLLYGTYLKNKPAVSIAAVDPLGKEKLDFLLEHGFITQEIHDKVMSQIKGGR